MAWSAPNTAVANTVYPAATYNQYTRDNLSETFPAKATAAGQIAVSTGPNSIAVRTPATASITTLENSTSTSYADIPGGTVGPQVTVTTGANALVLLACKMLVSAANNNAYMGFLVSGATTQGAFDSGAVSAGLTSALAFTNMSLCFMVTGLTPGSNTFKCQYRVDGATGGFSARKITVIPF
jgi:hypothetical protein